MDSAPSHGEQRALQTISHNARFQTAAEKSNETILGDNLPGGVAVADRLKGGLASRLENTEGIRAGVRHARTREANSRVADQGAILKIEGLRRYVRAQPIVGRKPWKMTNPGGTHGSQAALPKGGRMTLCLLDQPFEAVGSFDLLGSLPGIDWHQKNAKASRRERRESRFVNRVHVASLIEISQDWHSAFLSRSRPGLVWCADIPFR